jgi:hypothetical protein
MRIPTHAAWRRTSQNALRNPTFEQLAGAGPLIVWLSTDAGRLISTQLLASGAAPGPSRPEREGLHHKHRIPVGLVESPFGPANGRQHDARTVRKTSRSSQAGAGALTRLDLSSTLIRHEGRRLRASAQMQLL